MRYLSVCSGIEAATVAWHPIGWTPTAFSEIEAFPRAVLAHHYPKVPLHGDFTTIKGDEYGAVDLLVGGTPCQSYSVAGLRKGLDDPRGNLMLEYGALAERLSARWLVWENVPGVLSSNGGRDFGVFLGMLAELGYGFAYRVLDAQYYGVAQRRRRVFVVGCLGDWRSAAAVLFERHSMSGNPAPSRNQGEGLAKTLTRGACQRYDFETEDFVVAPMLGGWDYENNAHGPNDPTGPLLKGSPTGGGRPLPAVAFGWQNSAAQGMSVDQVSQTLDKSKTVAVQDAEFVRRLTPRECERLQGFPDDYTLIPVRRANVKVEVDGESILLINGTKMVMAADGPRYKALGNSMAVPVMRWIGERIQAVCDIQTARREVA